MKLKNRIIVLLSTTFVVLILVFGGVIYMLASNYAFNDFYDRLRTRTNTKIRIELDHRGDKKYIKQFTQEYLEKLPKEKSYIVELDKNGSPLVETSETVKRAKFIQKIAMYKEVQSRDHDMLMYGMFYRAKDGRTYAVFTMAKNNYYSNYISYLGGSLIIMVVSSIVLIVFVSFGLSVRLVRPIKDVTQNIHKIGTENLHIRLKVADKQDELGELIQTMNNMFDRLETSFETQNNFISNASHELNTPLTAIMGEADLMLQRDREIHEYRAALTRILAQAEKLNKKTKALLALAQTGFDGKKVNMTKVRLDELIFEGIEMITGIVSNHKVVFRFESLPERTDQMEVNGNKQLLLLALTNILINATKYSDNQEVEVYLSCDSDSVTIFISDRGIGIPDNELRYIYDPFFRASNTNSFEGYGIGLPLTRNIMRLHKGSITVLSEVDKGTVVGLVFPSN